MLHSGFVAMWESGWRGKLTAVGLVCLVALASVLGWIEERAWRWKRRLEK